MAPPPELAAISTGACIGAVGAWPLGCGRQREGRSSRDVGTQRLRGDPLRMPPPSSTPFWIMHDGRVVPRRPRRLLREQDEAITSSQLVKQINAVPGRPVQSAREVDLILQTLQWTMLPNGTTDKKKRWNITNDRDSHMRAFGFKQLMGFLPTLARQHAWYPWVYNQPELVRCAKCQQPGETQEHMHECADHWAVEQQLQATFNMLSHREELGADLRILRPWAKLGGLQGRVDAQWETTISLLQQDRTRPASTAAVTRRLLRASLEAWYLAI